MVDDHVGLPYLLPYLLPYPLHSTEVFLVSFLQQHSNSEPSFVCRRSSNITVTTTAAGLLALHSITTTSTARLVSFRQQHHHYGLRDRAGAPRAGLHLPHLRQTPSSKWLAASVLAVPRLWSPLQGRHMCRRVRLKRDGRTVCRPYVFERRV